MKKILSALAITALAACSTIPDYRALAAHTVPSNVELIGDFTNPYTGEEVKNRTFCSGVQLTQTDILTAGHCVNSADVRFDKKIKIRLANGKVYLATVVKSVMVDGDNIGALKARDSALLRIDVPELPNPAVIGDSTALKQGDMVAIVGNTLGELVDNFVVTYIGHTNRKLDCCGVFIQTGPGAAGGNSGGGVYNMKGELIGLLTRGADGVASLVVPIERVMMELEEANGDTTFEKLRKKFQFKWK